MSDTERLQGEPEQPIRPESDEVIVESGETITEGRIEDRRITGIKRVTDRVIAVHYEFDVVLNEKVEDGTSEPPTSK